MNYTDNILKIDVSKKENILVHNKNAQKIIEILKEELNEDRFFHTIGVAYTATALAMRHDADIDKAHYAGLLHDCAKNIPNKDKIRFCEEADIYVSEVERRNPPLLHAKLGAHLANKVFGITDKDILSSIEFHTTGCTNMTLLQKIVYIADLIEPGRDDEIEAMDKIRKMAFTDIDKALLMSMKSCIENVHSKGKEIDEISLEAYNYYAGKE